MCGGTISVHCRFLRGSSLRYLLAKCWFLLLIAGVLSACPSADPVLEDDGSGGSDSRPPRRDTGNGTADRGQSDRGHDLAVGDAGVSDSEPVDGGNDGDQRVEDSSGEPVEDSADITNVDVGTPEDISIDLAGCTPLPTSSAHVINGELDMDTSPQWSLPNTAVCAEEMPSDSPALYAVHELCSTAPGLSFDILAEGGRDDSGLTMTSIAIFIYRDGGLPDDPTECVAQTNNVAEDVALIDDFAMPVGRRITIVASSYWADYDGTYRITITPN